MRVSALSFGCTSSCFTMATLPRRWGAPSPYLQPLLPPRVSLGAAQWPCRGPGVLGWCLAAGEPVTGCSLARLYWGGGTGRAGRKQLLPAPARWSQDRADRGARTACGGTRAPGSDQPPRAASFSRDGAGVVQVWAPRLNAAAAVAPRSRVRGQFFRNGQPPGLLGHGAESGTQGHDAGLLVETTPPPSWGPCEWGPLQAGPRPGSSLGGGVGGHTGREAGPRGLPICPPREPRLSSGL